MYCESMFRQAPRIQKHNAEAALTSLYILKLGRSLRSLWSKSCKNAYAPEVSLSKLAHM